MNERDLLAEVFPPLRAVVMQVPFSGGVLSLFPNKQTFQSKAENLVKNPPYSKYCPQDIKRLASTVLNIPNNDRRYIQCRNRARMREMTIFCDLSRSSDSASIASTWTMTRFNAAVIVVFSRCRPNATICIFLKECRPIDN